MSEFTELLMPHCDATDGSCHLCGDVAVVGRVLHVDETARTATVRFDSHSADVALDLVDAQVGDDVLVHLGFALQRVCTA